MILLGVTRLVCNSSSSSLMLNVAAGCSSLRFCFAHPFSVLSILTINTSLLFNRSTHNRQQQQSSRHQQYCGSTRHRRQKQKTVRFKHCSKYSYQYHSLYLCIIPLVLLSIGRYIVSGAFSGLDPAIIHIYTAEKEVQQPPHHTHRCRRYPQNTLQLLYLAQLMPA